MYVTGEVYNVKEAYEDGLNNYDDAPADWYEYEVSLHDDKGNVIDSWNSLEETYNGMQQLTEEEAERALKEIKGDCEKGNYSNWFSLS